MHVTNSSRSIGEEKTKFIRLDHMNSHDSEGKANVAQKQKYQRVEGCGSLHSFKDPC